MKKIIFIYILAIIGFSFYIDINAENTVGDKSTMNALLDITGENNIVESENTDGFDMLTDLIIWFKNSLTGLMQLIAVGAFLFVGIRIAVARGNPEEFKKALKHMIYVIVGIFIVSIAWALVALVAGINL
ncbi:pilin [Candidatus Gracilibacteria bacterium]|nr:pilin [Candidatus Gracilibacteria bacterium]